MTSKSSGREHASESLGSTEPKDVNRWPTSEDAQRFGFEWGPLRVVRCVHIEDRGRVLVVATDHAEIEVFVSEKGRKIKTYERCLCGCEARTERS